MHIKSLVATGIVSLAFVGSVVPAGAGGGGGVCSGLSSGTSVEIRDFCFDGAAHVTSPGEVVRLINYGETTHDVTAADGSFASGPLAPGETFQVTVESRGVVPYYCSLHGSAEGSGMAGVLVSESDAAGVVTASIDTDTGALDPAAAATAPTAEAASTEAIDAALVAAVNGAQGDATVALVVVTVIGMAVAFGLGLVVWAIGRIPDRRSASP